MGRSSRKSFKQVSTCNSPQQKRSAHNDGCGGKGTEYTRSEAEQESENSAISFEINAELLTRGR